MSNSTPHGTLRIRSAGNEKAPDRSGGLEAGEAHPLFVANRLHGRTSHSFRMNGTIGCHQAFPFRKVALTAMLRNKKRVWTAEDDRRLRELQAAGRSSISIAAALKRSSEAIRGRLSFLRTEQRPGADPARADTRSKEPSQERGIL
jgi:hypothetical protein